MKRNFMKLGLGLLLVVVLGLSLVACGKNKSSGNMVLVNGEYVPEEEAEASEALE